MRSGNNNRRTRTHCRALALAVAIAAALPAYAVSEQSAATREATTTFDIPAGDLSAALERFSTQSGIQAMYRQELVAGKRAKAVSGALAPAAALARLLDGTGLVLERVNDRTYVVKAAPAPAKAPRKPAKEKASEASATPAQASQDRPIEDMDNVVVVGSRLGGSPVESAMPIKLITREDIDRSGAGNIAQVLTYLSEVPINSMGDREIGVGTGLAEGGNTNSTTVQMRGLPRGTTLILINGRRAGNSAMFTSTGQFDLSTIPLAMVERIEVLPAGSSAVYGGDGLAGVVNVVLRHDASGMEVRARKTMTHGYSQDAVSAMWGKSWNRGSMTVAANWSRNDALFSSERAISADQDYRRFGGLDRRGWSGNPPTVFSLAGCPAPPRSCSGVPLATRAPLPGLDFPMATAPLDRDGKGLTTADFLATQGQVHKESSNRHLRSAEKNHGLTVTGRFSLLPKVELFSELTYTRRDVPAYQVPFGVSGETGAVTGRIEADHPYNPFGVPVGVNFYYVNTGIYTAYAQEHVRGTIGARGKLGRYEWEVSGIQSRDKGGNNGAQGWDVNKLIAALAVTDPAKAINPFVTDGSAPMPNDVLHSMLRTDLSHNTSSRGDVWTGFVRGPVFDLPAGEVQGLLGLEHYRQEVRVNSNHASLVTKHVNGVSTSNAAFAEVRVPILSAREGSPLERIAMTGAVRQESSDRFKDHTMTQTLGLEVRPFDSLLLRSTYSTAFRPLLAYAAVQDPQPTQHYVRDPKFNGQAYYVPGYLTGGVPPELGPETSTTTTFGVLYRPSQDWSLSLTHWDMKFRDRIGFISVQSMVENEQFFPDRVVREPSTGYISFVDMRQVNISVYDSAGVDIAADAYLPTRFGDVTAGLSATYTYKHQTQLTDQSPLVNNMAVRSSDGWAPRWKIVPRVGWEPRDGLHTMLVGRYVSRYRDSTKLSTGPNAGTYPVLGDFWMFDLNADLELGKFLKAGSRLAGSRISFGATNVLNKQPEFCMGCGLGGYDASTYDIMGRTYYAEWRMSF